MSFKNLEQLFDMHVELILSEFCNVEPSLLDVQALFSTASVA